MPRSKKSKNNNSKRSILIALVLIIIILALPTLFRSSTIMKSFVCQMYGNVWEEVGPNTGGCFKQYSDKGAKCTNGNDCQALACITFSQTMVPNTQQLQTEQLAGVCPGSGPDIGEYEPQCGSATIENGSVVIDKRKCIY